MRLLIAALALLSALLGGCAAVPMASVDADKEAKQFQPRPGMANIYLYRNESFGGAIAMTVSLNGKVMGRTGPSTYFLWEVPPGKYEVVSHTENVARITIDARPNRNHFIWQEVKMGMWTAGSHLVEKGEEEGRKGVLECTRATHGD
jgi:hypothetical protein